MKAVSVFFMSAYYHELWNCSLIIKDHYVVPVYMTDNRSLKESV